MVQNGHTDAGSQFGTVFTKSFDDNLEQNDLNFESDDTIWIIGVSPELSDTGDLLRGLHGCRFEIRSIPGPALDSWDPQINLNQSG